MGSSRQNIKLVVAEFTQLRFIGARFVYMLIYVLKA